MLSVLQGIFDSHSEPHTAPDSIPELNEYKAQDEYLEVEPATGEAFAVPELE